MSTSLYYSGNKSASSLHNSTRVNMSSNLKELLVDVLLWAHTILNPLEYLQLSVDTRDYHCSWRSRVTSPPQDPHYRSLPKSSPLFSTYYLPHFIVILINILNAQYLSRARVSVMTFNATFNNISVISWWSVLLVLETGVPGGNIRPAASHWQTL